MIPITPGDRIRHWRTYYRTLAVELLNVLTDYRNTATVNLAEYPTKEELREVLELYRDENLRRENENNRALRAKKRVS